MVRGVVFFSTSYLTTLKRITSGRQISGGSLPNGLKKRMMLRNQCLWLRITYTKRYQTRGVPAVLGNGVFLSTVHSVKGLEFDHVFILADNWGEKQGEEMEEERRLYYVAMSRARETLHLFEYANETVNPHTNLIKGDFLHIRKGGQKMSRTFERRNYTLLGMEDLIYRFRWGSEREPCDSSGTRKIESRGYR